jgi:hypothetical protein
MKEIIIGSSEPTNKPNEYKLKCGFCGNDVYLTERWDDKSNAKYICSDCYEKSEQPKDSKIIVDERVAKSMSEEYGIKITVEELTLFARTLKEDIEIPESLQKKLDYMLFIKALKDEFGKSSAG